jgi:hypothetical protein
MELAQKLLAGKFHEIEDEEDIANALVNANFNGNKSIFALSKEEQSQQSKLDKFEN